MTCIVGLAKDGNVTIGADSAGVAGYAMTRRLDRKVFVKSPFIYGFTSSFRMGQILRWGFNPPPPPPHQSEPSEDQLFAYLVTTYANALRQALRDAGWLTVTENQERGGTFLLGVQGRLFRIECDFQVGESHDQYDAVGCGAEYALGSLFTSDNGALHPQGRVMDALMTAAHFSAGVSVPINILTLTTE